MHRAILGAAAVLTLLATASPSLANPELLPVKADRKHICVLLDSEKREGYCVETEGVNVPKLPDLPDRP